MTPTKDAVERVEREGVLALVDSAVPYAWAHRYPTWPPVGATIIRFDTGGRKINGSKPIENIPLYTKDTLERIARAAIDALSGEVLPREATIEMTHAALQEARRHDPPLLPSCKEIWASEIIWRTMRDAALLDTSKPVGE